MLRHGPPSRPTPVTEPEKDSQQESLIEQMQREADEEGHHLQLRFLGPDYLSYNEEYTVISSGGGTGASDTDTILKITDPPAASGSASDKLLVHRTPDPVRDDAREKELTACIEPDNKDDFRDEDFLQNAQESTFGLKREKQKWVYAWDLGYAVTAMRGYHTECPVSVPPPVSMVGNNELFPEWKKIKSAYPAAEDAFSSPSHDLLLIVVPGQLIIASVLNGKVGESLAKINLIEGPVMVQWAIGKYVDAWTKELAPHFHAYASDEARRDPKLDNADGLIFMRRHQPGSAVGWFVGAAMGDPSNAEYTNNTGFAYYQMGKYDESVLWLEKTISIDPGRAVAYLNLGDAYAKLKHISQARQAYTKYLELAPDSKSVPKVKKKARRFVPIVLMITLRNRWPKRLLPRSLGLEPPGL
jgi:tetratricopeptide (TPR) repeat protein